MSTTVRLRDRAKAVSRDVLGRIADNGGHVLGTITEIREALIIGGFNNETRVALGVLCKEGLLKGTPLDSISIGLPAKKYLYQLTPKGVLLARLDLMWIKKSGTAADLLCELDLVGQVTPVVMESIVEDLVLAREIRAPISVLPNDTDRPLITYLYWEKVATAA